MKVSNNSEKSADQLAALKQMSGELISRNNVRVLQLPSDFLWSHIVFIHEQSSKIICNFYDLSFSIKHDNLHLTLSFRIDLRRALFSPRGTLTTGIKGAFLRRGAFLTGERFDFSRCFETERGERYLAADAGALYN